MLLAGAHWFDLIVGLVEGRAPAVDEVILFQF